MMGDGSGGDRGGDPIAANDLFGNFIPTRGDYPCSGSGCHARVELPGICDDCDNKLAQRAHERVMRSARESIPPHFRWARTTAAEWPKRVSERLRANIAQLKGRLPKCGLVIVGDAGDGKTSAACAILNQIHDTATFDAPAKVVERARRAFFVSAPDLESDFAESARRWESDEAPLTIRLARSASILLLDDVGQGKRNSEIARLVQARHNDDLPTIITTWMTRAKAAECYGDGWARRAYEWEIHCR